MKKPLFIEVEVDPNGGDENVLESIEQWIPYHGKGELKRKTSRAERIARAYNALYEECMKGGHLMDIINAVDGVTEALEAK